MKREAFTILFITGFCMSIEAQDAGQTWGIKFSGYVKTDIIYDTRQTSAANGIREGHFYLYPDDVLYDSDMNDLNANSSFHILNIQSRLRGDITGPDAFGAKTSGAIEAEFFGTGESDLNGFRLRHAYVLMDWPHVTLLTGQYWHPMFITESFPGTISFNTGAPFTPFSRNPQVRITGKLGAVSLTAAAWSERDFVSSGPDGNSNKYLRNSGIPGLHFQVRIPAGDLFTAWAGVDYKRLRPEIRTSANAETDVMVGSVSAFANIKIKTKPVHIAIMGVYSQNASDMVMIGGYAVSEITDEVNQFKKYTTLNTANLWIDVNTTGKRVAFGIFSGYSKNLGSGDIITGTSYGRGNDIDHLFRISPRITITEGKLSFAGEVETTTAAYGTIGSEGRVSDTHNVTNIRLLLSVIYRF
ncbi:MAG: hypothetical protein MUC78_08685 [Bacteroidales bacterium]|jgi:hypothetical protein|nr:hypothetical protein [Bacteroidales bacterium]